MDAEISLELMVGCDSCCVNKKRKATDQNGASGIIFKRMKPADYRELRKEERRSGVSLELKLGQYDPWAIKKTIVTSDLGHLSKLLLAADGVRRHILPHWDAERIENIKNGVRVSVWDCDTKSEHQLLFKRWTSGSHVFIEGWKGDFVGRRKLKKGDEIGLYWDPGNSRFNFCLLKRGPS
ncbi:B3 domain-containing protein At2g33720-like [Corylus avellana]|uniref:B3 domain-containing protein At2g33720-like n=1 Tax=Corylus avellana TaxID=13451 RepID=UPI00286D685B|nr:B3 domain-containing protein At2g33720-like [Corylus avellana]